VGWTVEYRATKAGLLFYALTPLQASLCRKFNTAEYAVDEQSKTGLPLKKQKKNKNWAVLGNQ
jgi:hypothetical protein